LSLAAFSTLAERLLSLYKGSFQLDLTLDDTDEAVAQHAATGLVQKVLVFLSVEYCQSSD
jgi:hypothetical protein